MKITLLGHASFLLETQKGTKIVTDPYESGSYGGAVGYDSINLPADIVTASHQHADHHYTLPFGRAKIVDQPGQFTIEDVAIEGILSYHDNQKGASRGENIIFIIRADGIKLVHFGDLGTLDIDYAKFNNIDIALVPVGGTFTLDAAQARQLVSKIKPKVTIPMHFKTTKLGFGIDGVDKFISGQAAETRDFLEVTPENLDSLKRIVVLNYQR